MRNGFLLVTLVCAATAQAGDFDASRKQSTAELKQRVAAYLSGKNEIGQLIRATEDGWNVDCAVQKDRIYIHHPAPGTPATGTEFEAKLHCTDRGSKNVGLIVELAGFPARDEPKLYLKRFSVERN